MRIVAPIIEASELRPDHMYAMLDANYHSVLDARYAISDGMVMAAFIHPSHPCTRSWSKAPCRQVVSALKPFGGNYSSGELLFGPGRGSGSVNGPVS